MPLYRDEPRMEPSRSPTVGVLLTNLGTPKQPTPRALRKYLKEFLWDPRVVELPRLRWWLILHLFILTTRPRQSARLYRKIWTAEGSPLLNTSARLTEAVTALLRSKHETPVEVALGMRYGRPSVAEALRELKQRGSTRLVCLPLYPQYSATTTASTFDALAAELTTWRVVPELRTIHQYHDDPAYIAALAASVRELWTSHGEPEKLLLSFHGIPLRYSAGGDPYHRQCLETARLLGEELGVADDRYQVAFQSRFGREAWIEPATDATVQALGRAGIASLDVLCPGFAVDCLETLEEIDQLNRELFLAAGGQRFRYVPCLNDRPDHARALAALIERHLRGWV